MLKKFRQFILVFGDIVLAFTALLLAVRIGFWTDFTWPVFQEHLLPFGILYTIWLVLFYVFGLYDLNLIKPKAELVVRTGQCLILCLAIAIILFYFVPFFGITPKSNLLIDTFIFAIFIIIWRRTFYTLFSTLYQRNIAFLGQNKLAERLILAIKNDPQFGYKLRGFLEQNRPLNQQIIKEKIDVLVIAEDLSNNQHLTAELYQSLPLKIKFWDLAQAHEIILQKIPIDFINQRWFLENLRESEKKTYDNLKRISDILISAILLLITLPLWFFIAIIIKLEDNGPIFYKQERIGKDRRAFRLWKFRSMRTDAEKQGAVWAAQNDDRVTKIGRVIRRWHLDEFPQMLNVLMGDISLVGPRPERPEFVAQLERDIPHYHLRHLVKSGFTGWAQIKFRYARTIEDSHEKFQYDLYYIKNRSFFLDLGILLKTFQLFFKREGQP